MANVYIVMGVSGCGKTTVGKALANRLRVPFFDADDYHPQKNIDKMAHGQPLQDEDRWPWLDILSTEIYKWQQDKGAILACSALKDVYRERLFLNARGETAFAKARKNIVYLKADYEVIKARLARRENHFFDPALLQSQFDTLEEPAYGIEVDAALPIEVIVEKILLA